LRLYFAFNKTLLDQTQSVLNADGPLPFKLVFDVPGGEYRVPVGWGGEGKLKASAIKGREYFRHFGPQI